MKIADLGKSGHLWDGVWLGAAVVSPQRTGIPGGGEVRTNFRCKVDMWEIRDPPGGWHDLGGGEKQWWAQGVCGLAVWFGDVLGR